MKRMLTLGATLLAFAVSGVAVAADSEYATDYINVLKEINAAVDCDCADCSYDSDYSGDPLDYAVSQLFAADAPRRLYPQYDRPQQHVIDLDKKPAERIGYNGRIYGKYSDDDIAELTKWEKEFELSLSYGDWDSYMRWSDVNTFHDQQEPFRWEKGRLRYRGNDISITVGSFGQLFGRGLALNMYEDRILDHDNELEGVKAELALGDAEVTALWGTRKLRTERTNATVTAARIAGPVAEGLEIGGHVARVEFPDYSYTPETPNMLEYDLYGGDVTIRSGPFRMIAETVRLQRDELEYGQGDWDYSGDNGHGYYSNASYNGDGFVLGAEYKDYNGLLHPFAVLPPVRRFNEAASAQPNNDKGYLLSLFWNPFRNGSHFDIHYAQDNMHEKGLGYTEAALVYASPPTKQTSWVGEYWHVHELGQDMDFQRLTVNHAVTPDWAAGTFMERQGIDPGYIDAYTDYILEAEVAYQSKFNAAYTYETTGESDVTEDNWGLWEFKFKPDELQEMTLAVGSRREGIACSGGVCRLEPAFDGIRVDYLRRF